MTGVLLLMALACAAGIAVGVGLRDWWLATHSAILNDAIRDGVTDNYRNTKDGRNADNYAPNRYANGG